MYWFTDILLASLTEYMSIMNVFFLYFICLKICLNFIYMYMFVPVNEWAPVSAGTHGDQKRALDA